CGCAGFEGRREVVLNHDAVKWNRIMISSLCLSMISAQTRSAFVARENRFPLCAYAALRVRIMLYRDFEAVFCRAKAPLPARTRAAWAHSQNSGYSQPPPGLEYPQPTGHLIQTT